MSEEDYGWKYFILSLKKYKGKATFPLPFQQLSNLQCLLIFQYLSKLRIFLKSNGKRITWSACNIKITIKFTLNLKNSNKKKSKRICCDTQLGHELPFNFLCCLFSIIIILDKCITSPCDWSKLQIAHCHIKVSSEVRGLCQKNI